MIRSVLGKFWLACAGVIVLLAVLLSLVRVLLPYADSWRGEVEARLAAAFGQEVSIGRLAAQWSGLAPQLELEDLRVGGAEGGSRFGRAHLEVDVPRSLLNGMLYIRKLTVSGLHLTIVRQADGGILVAGLGNPLRSGAGAQTGVMLPARGRLLAEDAEVRLIDLAAPGGASDLLFTDVDFELWSAVDRHQIEGEFTPPAGLGARLRFALDLHAPARQPWRAQLYIDGAGVPLQAWFADRLPGVRPAGLANASVWMDWSGGVLRRVDGVFTVRGLVLARTSPPVAAPTAVPMRDEVVSAAAQAPAPYTLETASGMFAWRGFDGGWRLDVGDLVLDHGAGPASPRRFALGTGQRGLEPGALVARMDALPVEEVPRLLALAGSSESLTDMLAGVRPRGLLRDIAASFRSAGADSEGEDERADEQGGEPSSETQTAVARHSAVSPRFRLQANFEDVAGDPWRSIPGFTGAAGNVHLDERGGMLDLRSGPGELAFDGLFRAPLPLSRLQATLAWERRGEGWRLHLPALDLANEDLTLNASGRIDLPARGGSPVVDLHADFEAATVANVRRYLPVRIMPAGTVLWLDDAIKSGSVPRGELILRGPLRGFPYDRGQGLFRVDFDLRDGMLEYSGFWPRIESIEARLMFTGRRMEIAAAQARTLGSTIGPTRIGIADMTRKPAILTVDGSARGPVADGLAFLRDTPLAPLFGPYVEDVTAAGNHLVELSLKLPLGGKAEVDGTVTFEDSALALGGSGVEIKHIKGPVRFSHEGLHGEGLTVNLLGLPATMSVSTSGEGEARRTQVEARGVVTAADAERLAHLPASWLDGASSWRARLAVPGVEEIRSDGMMLYIESALEGMAITLPAPLAKSSESALSLLVSLPLPRSAVRPVTVALGDRAVGDGLSIALGFDAAQSLERGELRFGGGEAELPDERGLRIVGRVSGFSLAEWQRALALADDRARAAPVPIRAVDVAAGRVDVFGRTFDEARISARPTDAGWQADIRSRQMAGRLDVPLESGPPWRADLEYLHLAAMPADSADAGDEGGSRTAADPRRLPAMRIDSKHFTYGDTDFGTLRLHALPAAAGIRLEQLSLVSPVMRVEARGDWVQVADEQYSSFNIEFDTDDFGRALAGFGYADSFRGGKGHSTISARWSGAPTAFALARLHGSMDISISDGRLLDVEPGAGRIFGLISLQALPRRLTLDFSDFFGKGFGFDRITGSFIVRDGVARTEDLIMVGPAARIEARGDVDLAGRRYDQTVLVVPNVGSGLPLAGAVAGGVPIGAAMLLMERVFKDDIERMTRLHYRVTGPWHEPLVERLQESTQSGKR